MAISVNKRMHWKGNKTDINFVLGPKLIYAFLIPFEPHTGRPVSQLHGWSDKGFRHRMT